MLTSLLAACASTAPAPVEDRSLERRVAPPAPAAPRPVARDGRYRVERGDTLYSIAFRHGVDYRDVAAWNGIGPPYTIYIGQELRVSPPARTVAAAARASSPPARVARADDPKPSVFEPVAPPPPGDAAVPPAAPASASAATPPPTKAGDAARPPVGAPTAAPVAAAPPATASAAKPAAAAPPVETPVAAGEVAWRWPADGRIAGSFVPGDPTRQGIDIVGKAGDPVRAAADGTVVYSGNGLVGYGELIIIKHSPSFLSAYGHNRKRLVKEGDRVRAGQVVAEMGSSSATRDSLHFEIRRNGKPGNPLDYLPRR